MKYIIKRGNEIIKEVRPEGELVTSVMGEEIVTMRFSLPTIVDFHTNDSCEVFGNIYYLSKEPLIEKENARLFHYTLEFTGVKYELAKIQYMLPDASNELTLSEFHIMGNAQQMIDLIVQNANRLQSGWSVGTIDDTDAKQIDFAEDNCLSALAKITETFKLEYWVDGDKSIHLTKRTAVSGYSFQYGKAKGLRNLNREPFEGSNLVTRLYAKGSERNIAGNYRNGQRHLRMPVPYLEKNTDKYGIIEHTQLFPEIYPKRIGTVTEVFSDFLKFKDADIDFDLNARDANGTTILIDGVSAKVNFLTGQLAGYTFELRERGYNSQDKTFTLLKNKDEKAIEVPSEVLRPAVGDTYVLTDIIMPESYVTNAENELKQEAQRYLNENSEQRNQYTLVADPFYFKKQNVNIELGYSVHAIDSDFNLDANLRVIQLVKNLQNPYDVQFSVAERAEIAYIVREYIDTEKQRKATIRRERINAEMAKRSYNFAREVHDNVFDQEGYFDTDKIKPLSIDTSMISVGSRSQQFNLPNIVLTVERNNAAVRNTAGQLVHLTIGDQPRTWEIPANIQIGIGSGYHYIYVKAQKQGENASIYVSDEQLPIEGEDFYYFLAGSLGSVDNGFRRIKTTYGFTQISPGEITTGRISSTNGQNYIELLDDKIKIKASLDITSDSPAFNQIDNHVQPKIDGAKSYAENLKKQGTIYIRGTGLNRPALRLEFISGVEKYNGGGRGIRLSVLNRSTLAVTFSQNYDVYIDQQAKLDLADKLNSLEESTIVLLTSWDAINPTDVLMEAIYRCGGSIPKSEFSGRMPYALVGIPGIGKGAGLESYSSTDANAPYAEISTQVINGYVVGIDTSSKYLEQLISDAEQAAIEVAEAKANLARIQAQAHADNKISEEEQRAITYANQKLALAKAYADAQDNLKEIAIKAYADGVADEAEQAAIDVAEAKANLAKTQAQAYADNVVTAAERRAIADAQAKLAEAKAHSQELVESISIGGRNMVLDSDVTSDAPIKHFNFSFEDDLQQLRGQEIVISVGISCQNATSGRIGFEPSIVFSDGTRQFLDIWHRGHNGDIKKRISKKITILDKEISRIYQRGCYNQLNSDATATWSRPALYFGNKELGWTPAPEDIEAKIQQAKDEAEQAAENLAVSKANLARIQAQAHADNKISEEEQRAIADANQKLALAKAYADAQDNLKEIAIKAYADGVADEAEQAAIDVAEAKANLAKTQAQAYADNVVTAAERRAIADAQAKLAEAKAHSQELVESISIGGRNMVLDSDVTSDAPIKHFNFSFEDDLQQLRGQEIVISVGISCQNATSGRIGFEPSIVFSDGTRQFLGIWHRGHNGDIKKRISKKITILDKEISRIYQRGCYNQLNSDATATWSRPALYFGNKELGWVPAPEDLNTGTRNLLLNTKNSRTSNDYIAYEIAPDVDLSVGDYTFMADIRGVHKEGYVDVYFRTSSEVVGKISKNKWTGGKLKFNLKLENLSTTPTYIYVRSNQYVHGNTENLQITCEKAILVKGNNLTGWSPSPEDIEADSRAQLEAERQRRLAQIAELERELKLKIEPTKEIADYLAKAFKEGVGYNTKGGVILASIMGVRDEQNVVKSYMNGNAEENPIAFAAGVEGFGTDSERQKTAIMHNGEIHTTSLHAKQGCYIGDFRVESSGIRAGGNDDDKSLYLGNSGIAFRKPSERIFSAIGSNVIPSSSGIVGLQRLEYEGNSNRAIGLYINVKPRGRDYFGNAIQRALNILGNYYQVGSSAIFETEYIGEAFNDIVEVKLGRAHTYIFTTANRTPVRLPNAELIRETCGESRITFELKFILAESVSSFVRIQGVRNGYLLNNDANVTGGGNGHIDLGRGDTLTLRYHDRHYYIISHRN